MGKVDQIFWLRRLTGAGISRHGRNSARADSGHDCRYLVHISVGSPSRWTRSAIIHELTWFGGDRPCSAMTIASWRLYSPAARSGTSARAGLGALADPIPARWPWPTFVVNIVGAFLLGYFTTRLLERLPLSSYRRPMLGTGLCGGLTTFSTMQVETLKMLEHHHYGLAAGYTVGQYRRGLVAVYVATVLVRA